MSESSDKDERSEFKESTVLCHAYNTIAGKNNEKKEKKSRERQRSEAKNSFMADHDLRYLDYCGY